MHRLLWVVVGSAALAAAGCDSTDNEAKEPAVRLTVDQNLPSDASKLAEGELHAMTVTIENTSDRAVLLLELSTDRDLDRPFSWQKPRYGGVTASPDGLAYTHQELLQQATPAVFSSGLLWPGEKTTQALLVRPFGAARKLRVAFISMSDKLLAAHVYFPEANAAAGDAHTYRRLTAAQIRDLRAGQHPAKSEEAPAEPAGASPDASAEPPPSAAVASEATTLPAPERVVIFPSRDQFEPETAAVTAALDLQPITPSLEAAAQTAGVDPLAAPHTYWAKRRAWVFRSPAGTVGVSAAGKADLPAMDLEVFDLLDAAGEDPLEFKLPETTFADLLPLEDGDGMYRLGKFARVGQDDLMKVLDRARERGLRVGVTYYFFESWYLEVFPEPAPAAAEADTGGAPAPEPGTNQS